MKNEASRRWTVDPRLRGCDHWTGAYYCSVSSTGLVVDEVSEEVFCAQHAGPLAWPAHDVDLYGLALKVAGKARVIYLMPDELRARLYPGTARAA